MAIERRTLPSLPLPVSCHSGGRNADLRRPRGHRRGGLLAILAACLTLLALVGPAKAQQTAPSYCNASAFYSASTSGATRIVPASQAGGISICGFVMQAAAAVNLSLEYGSGSNCGTGTVAITPAYNFTTTP